MNDQILFDNYLMILKSTMEVYVHGTLESSNPDVRDMLKCGLDETVKHQARVYDEMTKNGWYTIENVKPTAINKTYTKLEQKN